MLKASMYSETSEQPTSLVAGVVEPLLEFFKLISKIMASKLSKVRENINKINSFL